MKIPFLSAKAEQTVNHVVDVASERVKQAVNTAADNKLATLGILIPIAGTVLFVMSESGGSKRKNYDIPTKTTIINNYYYGRSDKNERA